MPTEVKDEAEYSRIRAGSGHEETHSRASAQGGCRAGCGALVRDWLRGPAAKFFETLTPKRWELIAALKEAGPLTIYALAKRLDRHYRNVYRDVVTLTEWMLVEKDDHGRVFVPWDEIDL